MKQYFGIILAVLGVGLGIGWTMRKWEAKTADAARELSIARLRGDYLERAPFLRSITEQKQYVDENQTFLKWYFKEVAEHLAKHGGNREFDDYLKELDARSAKNSKDDEGGKIEERKAAYAYTRAVFDTFRKGDYAPWWSSIDDGIRFDIVSADTVRQGTEEKIHMPVVVWGLPRDERTDDRGVHRVKVNASFRFNWKLYDDKNKLIAEIPGEGGPDSRVDWPERYVKFFPPGVVIGHYDIDKLPAETKTLEIEWSISARATTGGDLNAAFHWKGDAPAAWKLAAGEGWKGAQESIRPEDEIDPSKAKKK
jgi:hypothetical protein